MKRVVFIFLTLILMTSCDRTDKKKFIVTDFSKKRIDTLIPYKDKSYAVFFIEVKGFSNDSIKIKRKDHYDIKLIGDIDTIVRYDYYGGNNVIVEFDPYKATEGNLEIEYNL